jgi:GTP-binding protein Era
MISDTYRSGYVAVSGRPNTGKSSLVNALVHEKISIVTSKPQTTRHSILGIVTGEHQQVIFVDTPGMHAASGSLMNRTMNRTAVSSISNADVVLMVVESTGWRRGDDYALERIFQSRAPVILVINKTDLVKPKKNLLPYLKECSDRANFKEIVPVSAKREDNLDRLMHVIEGCLPAGNKLFPPDTRTDKSMEFRIAEALREKLLEVLYEEVPYGLAVEIAEFEERDDILLVEAIIWIEKESHKGIVIGRGGERLKRVGTSARRDLESIFGKRFHLQSRVKVKENWSDNERALRQLGYEVS